MSDETKPTAETTTDSTATPAPAAIDSSGTIYMKDTPAGWVVDPDGEPFVFEMAARGVVQVRNSEHGVSLTLTEAMWNDRPRTKEGAGNAVQSTKDQ